MTPRAGPSGAGVVITAKLRGRNHESSSTEWVDATGSPRHPPRGKESEGVEAEESVTDDDHHQARLMHVVHGLGR